MGKSVKKQAAPAVVTPAAPAVVAPADAVPKVKARKREAEDEIEKAVSAKKQKAAPAKAVPVPKKAAKKAKKQPPPKKADSGSSDEESSPSEEVKVQPKKAAKPVKEESSDDSTYESYKAKTLAVSEDQALRTKTLFVGNLPSAVDIQDVKQFFCGVAEAVDVCLATHDDGHPMGFGYVQFATAEDTDKALVLNGRELMGYAVRIDRAGEKSASAPITRDGDSFGKPSGGPSLSVFVKGFDKSQQRDDIESSLYKHFGKCGEITRVYVPMDHESGSIQGIAFIDFNQESSFNKALRLSRSSLGGHVLFVEKAKGEFGGGGRSGGSDGGGRFGGQSDGRDGGRRGGGQAFQSRQSAGTASAGKKITFNND